MSLTRTTRRALIVNAATALATAPVVAAAGASANLAADGVSFDLQQRWVEYRSAVHECASIDLLCAASREGLVARCGEPSHSRPAYVIWQHDPAYQHRREMMVASDKANGRLIDAMDAVMEVPAQTQADLAVKLSIVVSVWREMAGATKGFDDFHEDLAFSFLEDAERVLGIPSGSAGT